MKRAFRTAASVVLAIGLAGCEQSPPPTAPTRDPLFAPGPPTVVAFEAGLTQASLVSQSCEAGVCHLEFAGSGAANIMGAITWSAHIVQDFTTTPCNTALAEITLVGATGSITVSDLGGSVCPNPNSFELMGFISSSWEATAGTGAFSGISGSGTSQGPIGGNGPVVHLSGTVSF